MSRRKVFPPTLEGMKSVPHTQTHERDPFYSPDCLHRIGDCTLPGQIFMKFCEDPPTPLVIKGAQTSEMCMGTLCTY